MRLALANCLAWHQAVVSCSIVGTLTPKEGGRGHDQHENARATWPPHAEAWVQAGAPVALLGFAGLVLMGWITYQSHPPIADRVVSQSGSTVYTSDDVRAGSRRRHVLAVELAGMAWS